MITASIAYDQLTTEQRAKALAMLEGNPDFGKWKETAPKNASEFDFGRYIFMRAATWPDDIRKSGSPYDHPVWHYVDYPLEPPDFPLEPPPPDSEDLISALALCEKTVADPAASDVDRGAYLAWMIHLIGDEMQPLHNVTMITLDFPKPAGDKGGNAFYVSLAGIPINLHSYWDALGGLMLDTHEIVERATELERRYPRNALPELAEHQDLHSWTLEGRQLAIDVVYRRGTLPGGKEPGGALPALPGDYASTGRQLAERRLALAGYRMADTFARLKL